MTVPSLPQGMRDFDATTVQKRHYILDTIKDIFVLHGFLPLETPAMENLDTLLGKYGDEGDKLIFKVLNNGLNDEKNKEKAARGFEKLMAGKATTELTERALKYDLTIPFARYVAMNKNTITLPFKRFQTQAVWRADRPQRGRYREFTQCDVDVVGSKTLWNEVDLAKIYHEALTSLGLINYSLQINNRKILSALAEKINAEEKMTAITVIIDKLDKVGMEKLTTLLQEINLEEAQVNTVVEYLKIKGTNEEKINLLTDFFGGNTTATQGIEELSFIIENCRSININIDQTLARGLNYYTGCIFEVKAPKEVSIGSIGGGGRYDDLTGMFGVKDIPGVGISFGIDRIYDVLEELNLFPDGLAQSLKAVFFNMGEETIANCHNLADQLRKENIACEVYAENAKLDKQFKYAEKKGIPFVIMIGVDELTEQIASVKELKTGLQHKVKFNEVADFLNKG